MTPAKFSQLSVAKRKLIRTMQQVNYGSILNVTVADGEVKFDSQPEVLIDIRLDDEIQARKEVALGDFDLSAEVLWLLAQIELLKNGMIEKIVVHGGLPASWSGRHSLKRESRMNSQMTSTLSYLETVEQHFQAARGSAFFRFSPLDWALVEAWEKGGIPLEAVLRGIDRTFENWRRVPRARTEKVNSIAYCTQMIAAEAQTMANVAPVASSRVNPPFPIEEVREFVTRNASTVREKGYADLAAELEAIDLQALYSDLEQLEERLTSIEEKIIARLQTSATERTLAEARNTAVHDLKQYRANMTPDQLKKLAEQFLQRRLLESAGLPRLSLFYL